MNPKKSDALFPEIQNEPGVDAAAALKIKGAKQLRVGLHRVHAAFIAFVFVCVAALAICFPRLADEHRVDALKDLKQLSTEIDVAALRLQIAQKAERELSFDLEQVVQAVALPELTAKQGAGPQAQLQKAEVPALASLGALEDISQVGARFAVRGPNPEALAASLRWRLDKQREKRPLVLTGLALSHSVGLQAVDAEAIVEPARVEALQATAAYDQSFERYTALRDHCDELKKQGMSKKDMLPTVQERVAAYEVLTKDKGLMRRATRTYSQRSKRALRSSAVAPEEGGEGTVVVATLEAEGEKPLTIKIPLARAARFAFVPPFEAPAALTHLENNPLWLEIRSLDARAASKHLDQQLSFHLKSTEVAGLRVSGLAVLQAIPLVLLFFVWLLTRACRAVMRVYSPFGSNQGARLPNPGTGTRDLDRALFVVLPVAVASLICWTLWRLHAEPWIAGALSLGLVTQSLVANQLWKELHRLIDIARHRSLVQPLPERAVGRVNVPKLRGTASSGG